MPKLFSYHKNIISYDYLSEETPNPDDYYCHMHNDYEILYFIDGNADYIIDGNSYNLKKNTLIIIKPRVFHGLHVLTPQHYERCVFNFHSVVLPEELLPIIDSAHPIYQIDKSNPINSIFSNMIQLQSSFSESEFDYLKKSSLLNLITCIKYLSNKESLQLKGNDVLSKIVEYITEHIEEPLTSQMLSDYFFVSKSFIEHTFKSRFNIGVKSYINQKKILYAQALILSGEKLQDVCDKLSYVNYTTFYRNYKKYLGMDPKESKANLKEANKP